MKKDIKLITTLLFALLVLCIPISAMGADVYTHDKTGIILPHEIAEHKFNSKRVYEEKELGESVSYRHENATATVYIYDYNRNDIKDDSKHSLIVKELSNTTVMLKKLQEMEIYNDVKISKEGRVSGKDGQFIFISIPVTYNTIKSADTGEKIPPQAVNSMISIGIYKNHFIKIRYSFPHKEQDDLNKKYEQRDTFIDDIRKLILEVDIRKKVEDLFSIYLKDPFTEEGKDALGGIVAYAQMSPLVSIALNSEIMPWLKIKEYPYAKDLLSAYIAGQVDYQLSSNDFESNHKAGMDQVLQIYKLLRIKDEKAKIPYLEEKLKKI